MIIPHGIFKAYDIRGIYPTEINEKNIQVIIQAIFLQLSKALKRDNFTIALGRDMRLSSPSLFETAKSTLERL